MGGTITVESAGPGKGSTFTFTLPAGSAARGRLALEFEFEDRAGGRRGAVQGFCLMAMELAPVGEY